MVRLLLRREECQFILCWAQTAKDKAEEVGVPFEADELILVSKIRKVWETKNQMDEPISGWASGSIMAAMKNYQKRAYKAEEENARLRDVLNEIEAITYEGNIDSGESQFKRIREAKKKALDADAPRCQEKEAAP